MDTLAQVLGTWDDILAQLRCKSVSWRGNPLSERDLNTFTEAVVMCSLHLTDMSTRHDGFGSHREVVAWARYTCSLDVHDLGSFLSDATSALREIYEPVATSEFKRSLSQKYPFTGMFLMPISRVLDRFLSNPNPRDFRLCYQFLSFLTHLSLVDLAIDLEGEYEDLETYLHSVSYHSSLTDELNSIMREWFKDFPLKGEYLPSHGPGATSEVRKADTTLAKYRYLGTDALLSYVFRKHAGIDVTSYYPLPVVTWERQSTLEFVPKSMKTRRSISKEPSTLMYHQQGVLKWLQVFLERHPYLSSHISLDDQEQNAQMALKSSASHAMATIDLSSASDCVTSRLVKAVFRGTPIYPFLVALRSRTTELPSGKVVSLEKYAPMGSALCFPVETLIFSCAVELAVRRARRTHLGNFPVWRVYGDDIIVADALYGDVVLVLEALGFQVNASKSFRSPSRFRESCGAHGFDGVDVTPMKISRRFQSVKGRITSHLASQYEGLIDMANLAYVYDFSLLRAWIIRVLLEYPVGPPLFSGTTNGAVFSPQPDNYRALKRLNWDPVVRLDSRSSYQRVEIQVVVSRLLSQKSDDSPDLEQARLFETLRLIAHNRASDDMFRPEHRIQVPRGSGRTRLRKAWVEKPM